MIVTTTIEIDEGRITDLLTSAFEGGSNYWIAWVEKIKTPEKNLYPSEFLGDTLYLSDYPRSGGILQFHIGDKYVSDEDKKLKKKYILDWDACIRGMNLFASSKKYHHHFVNFINENDDAITADVYLQFCLFGDVIYG